MAGAVICDYLVVGTGAMGMSFTDVLLSENKDCSVIMVDRQPTPGGHWNFSYDFVTLHQPAMFYGVASERLETEHHNPRDLSSGPKICAYYRRVMEKFGATGRLRHLAAHEYLGEKGESVYGVAPVGDAGAHFTIEVRKKLVDATFLQVTVPAMRAPPFEVAEGARVVPINVLAQLETIAPKPSRFCVLGGGKTAMDAVLHLLNHGISQQDITWVVPNDSYMVDRDLVFYGAKPLGEEYDCAGDPVHQCYADRGGLRIDPAVMPTKFRCCTVARKELEAFRSVKDVVRMGRVKTLGTDQIELENGAVPTNTNTLHVDCTANGLTRRDPVPIFDGGKITLQSLVWCTYVISAAATAKLECSSDDNAFKNDVVTPVCHPESLDDQSVAMPGVERNAMNMKMHFGDWWMKCRLN